MDQRFDCIVAGFGTGGSIAAIAAGRRGARVLVLERGNSPGGTHTSGGVGGYYFQDSDGLQKELDILPEPEENLFLPGFAEKGKHSLETAALKAGVTILYGAVPVRILKENGRCAGVEYRSEGKLCQAYAPVLVDGTAEGILFRLAGAAMTTGRQRDGIPQPFTNSMLVFAQGSGMSVRNFDAGRMDPCQEPEASRIMLETALCHRKKDYGTDRRNAVPAVLPGLREGPHILPEGGSWTMEECFHEKSAKEVLFTVQNNIDTHANDLALESDLFLEWMVLSSLWGFNGNFPVPRKVMFSPEAPGIVAASRCLGVDHDLGHAVRMNGAMGRLGEIAGILTALSLRLHLPVEKVPYAELRKELPWEPLVPEGNRAVTDLSREEIRQALDSSKPGPGLWSIRIRKTVSAAELKEWMDHAPEGSPLRRHAALALTLLRDPSAIPELRKTAEERDSYRPDFSRKYNHARGYVSVCALGLLRDAGSVPLLAEVLKDPTPGGLRYEYHTHTIGALLRIGEACPAVRPEIGTLFRQFGEDPDWILEARLKGTENTLKRMDVFFRLAMAEALDRWNVPHRIRETVKRLSPDAYEQFLLERSVRFPG